MQWKLFLAAVSPAVPQSVGEFNGLSKLCSSGCPIGSVVGLTVESNRVFPISFQETLVYVPARLHHFLWVWLSPGFLLDSVPLRFPLPSVFIAMDGSDLGWGFQSLDRQQGQGLWPVSSHLLPLSQRAVSGVVVSGAHSFSQRDVDLFSDGQHGGSPLCESVQFVSVSPPSGDVGGIVLPSVPLRYYPVGGLPSGS